MIGRAEVIVLGARAADRAWHDARYVPGNIVVAAAGNLDHDADRGAGGRRAVGDRAARRRPARPARPGAGAPTLRFHARRPSSTTSAWARPGIPRGDDRRFALRVLDTILGGSTSSRLFQEVREKRGLAYSVYSYACQYADTGQVALYVGTRPDNVAEALERDRHGAAPAAARTA